VKLINNSDFDAAVELTLDGLNMFAFSKVPPRDRYRFVVVPKHSSSLIPGWHRTNQVSDEFVITDYSKSAVAELLVSPDRIGTIRAVFGAAWHPTEESPEDDSAVFRLPGDAVGRRDPVEFKYKEVVRRLGRVRDVISVSYQKDTTKAPSTKKKPAADKPPVA